MRFYKYLVADHYEEFAFALKAFVLATVKVVEDVRPGEVDRANNLFIL